MTKETELKPCPFCGNTYIDMWPMNGFELPICNQCGANICEHYSTGRDTKKQIQAWNTRNQQPQGDGELEEALCNFDDNGDLIKLQQDILKYYIRKDKYEKLENDLLGHQYALDALNRALGMKEGSIYSDISEQCIRKDGIELDVEKIKKILVEKNVYGSTVTAEQLAKAIAENAKDVVK